MKYFIIYKTTNLLNNKFYIGYHSTHDLNDEYLGSGKLLKKSISKYGIENFKKDILYVFPSKEEAFSKEKELVTEDFIKRSDTYNLKLGGEGGWDHTWNDPKRIKNLKKAHKEGRINTWLDVDKSKLTGMKGKKHTPETKAKIAEMKLIDKSILKQRQLDYINIDKSYGWISKLGRKWGVSHTQVRRFINVYLK